MTKQIRHKIPKYFLSFVFNISNRMLLMLKKELMHGHKIAHGQHRYVFVAMWSKTCGHVLFKGWPCDNNVWSLIIILMIMRQLMTTRNFSAVPLCESYKYCWRQIICCCFNRSKCTPHILLIFIYFYWSMFNPKSIPPWFNLNGFFFIVLIFTRWRPRWMSRNRFFFVFLNVT